MEEMMKNISTNTAPKDKSPPINTEVGSCKYLPHKCKSSTDI
jgi:hypothetical protein